MNKEIKDPLYGTKCVISNEISDETYYFCLVDKRAYSYALHVSLLSRTDLFDFMRMKNDEYHSNPLNKNFLTFCTHRTVFTNMHKPYVFIEDLMKGIEKWI